MKKRKFFTDDVLARIFRWWAASAMYFFVGWGTSVGFQSTVIDFVFFLGIAIAVFEMFVVNPVVNSMFSLKNPIRYDDTSIMKKVLYRLKYIGKTIIVIVFVVITYDIINFSAIIIFNLPQETVFLAGEPILFGIFYMVYYSLIKGIGLNIARRMKETT